MGRRAAIDEGPRKFGVYQKKSGSYTLGDFRFEPLTAVPVPADATELACEETSPIEFFDDVEAAQKNIDALKAKFAKQPKNQTQD